MTDPMSTPGRRLYEQTRALKRAKRQFLLRRGITAAPKEAAVLQFPNPKEVADGGEGHADLYPGA